MSFDLKVSSEMENEQEDQSLKARKIVYGVFMVSFGVCEYMWVCV